MWAPSKSMAVALHFLLVLTPFKFVLCEHWGGGTRLYMVLLVDGGKQKSLTQSRRYVSDSGLTLCFSPPHTHSVWCRRCDIRRAIWTSMPASPICWASWTSQTRCTPSVWPTGCMERRLSSLFRWGFKLKMQFWSKMHVYSTPRFGRYLSLKPNVFFRIVRAAFLLLISLDLV